MEPNVFTFRTPKHGGHLWTAIVWQGGEVGGEKALKGCLQEVRMSKNYTASHNT